MHEIDEDLYEKLCEARKQAKTSPACTSCGNELPLDPDDVGTVNYITALSDNTYQEITSFVCVPCAKLLVGVPAAQLKKKDMN
tara:strand:- start:1148 stop:1396 length:249 start_codon:yes stop_codon:yes gene_type:complete